MNDKNDDVRLPFSTLDPIIGDVFTTFWEPEMMEEMGNALKILTTEVLSSVGQTVLQATVMTALISALQWPLSQSPSLLSCEDLDLTIVVTFLSSHQAQLLDRQPLVERS